MANRDNDNKSFIQGLRNIKNKGKMSGLFNMLHRSVGQKNNKNTSKTVVSKTENDSS